MSSWEYLDRGNYTPGPPTEAQGPHSTYADYAAEIRRGLDQEELRRATEQRAQREFVGQQEVVQKRLDRLYTDKRYEALELSRVSDLHISLSYYEGLLATPGEAGHHLSKMPHFSSETSAAYLAAASILGEEPIYLHPLLRYFGVGSQTVNDNVQRARTCLTSNHILIDAPDGARGLNDRSLREFGLTTDELDRLGLGDTGRDDAPAALLVLAADAIHSSHSAILPLEGRRISDRKLDDARMVIRRIYSLARYNQIDVHELVLQSKDLENLRKAKSLIATANNRTLSEQQRRSIRTSVHGAGVRFFGFRGTDTGKLDIMAELLVAKAHLALHEAEPLPDNVLTAVANRLANAARKNGISSVDQLPNGSDGLARHIYGLFENYLAEKKAEEASRAQKARDDD